jgi:hypothetical protein
VMLLCCASFACARSLNTKLPTWSLGTLLCSCVCGVAGQTQDLLLRPSLSSDEHAGRRATSRGAQQTQQADTRATQMETSSP